LTSAVGLVATRALTATNNSSRARANSSRPGKEIVKDPPASVGRGSVAASMVEPADIGSFTARTLFDSRSHTFWACDFWPFFDCL